MSLDNFIKLKLGYYFVHVPNGIIAVQIKHAIFYRFLFIATTSLQQRHALYYFCISFSCPLNTRTHWVAGLN